MIQGVRSVELESLSNLCAMFLPVSVLLPAADARKPIPSNFSRWFTSEKDICCGEHDTLMVEGIYEKLKHDG